MKGNRFGFPDLGLGIGLRTVHFPHILETWPEIDFFEILSENFLDTDGRPAYVLSEICERYPVVLHGVSMSIGSTDPLNFDYLGKLKALADRTNALWVSDHLCWTGTMGRNTHDLLPMPYSEEALQHVSGRVRIVSDFLERPLILENPSTYLELSTSTRTEWDFLARLGAQADCGFLFDVNNVYVSAFNHGWDANAYIDAMPADRIVQYHLAGHTNKGTHIIDTHSDHVIDEVWQLYRRSHERTGPVSTLLEWDDDIPSFEVVHAEALKAGAYRRSRPATAETAHG